MKKIIFSLLTIGVIGSTGCKHKTENPPAETIVTAGPAKPIVPQPPKDTVAIVKKKVRTKKVVDDGPKQNFPAAYGVVDTKHAYGNVRPAPDTTQVH